MSLWEYPRVRKVVNLFRIYFIYSILNVFLCNFCMGDFTEQSVVSEIKTTDIEKYSPLLFLCITFSSLFLYYLLTNVSTVNVTSLAVKEDLSAY